MGLTIHYQLAAPDMDRAHAQQIVQRLRYKARDLSFYQVGAIIEYTGADPTSRQAQGDHPDDWLFYESRRTIVIDDYRLRVPPEHAIAFSTMPAAGSEPAYFGLATYPQTIALHDRVGRRPTGLTGWSWKSFCKTQFASHPDLGGLENFLRGHLALVQLLDHASHLGILRSVDDEGGYWDQRDLAALAGKVGDWNTMMAGCAERLKAAFGEDIVMPTERSADFEHRASEGREPRAN